MQSFLRSYSSTQSCETPRFCPILSHLTIKVIKIAAVSVALQTSSVSDNFQTEVLCLATTNQIHDEVKRLPRDHVAVVLRWTALDVEGEPDLSVRGLEGVLDQSKKVDC